MGVYQFYEFRTIDRTLTQEEREIIGSWSSRSYPTPTSVSFEYHYSDFPKEPEEVVAQYFDVMLYLANWGSKRLLFKFPEESLDFKNVKAYSFDNGNDDFTNSIRIYKRAAYIFIDVEYNDDHGVSWTQGSGWLSDMHSLRNDIINGDFRMLYLAWLFCASINYNEEDATLSKQIEPPVPPNLHQLNSALRSFIDFFDIDRDWISAGVVKSQVLEQETIDIDTAIFKLTAAEKHEFLVRLASGERHLGVKLFALLQKKSRRRAEQTYVSTRMIADLAELATKEQSLREKKERKVAEEERLVKLLHTEKNKVQIWHNVESQIYKGQKKSYETAIDNLQSLFELAKYRGQKDTFIQEMKLLREKFSRKKALIRRLDEAQLP